MIAGHRYFHLVDSPGKGASRCGYRLKNGADFIKIYAAGIRANPAMGYGDADDDPGRTTGDCR